MKKFAFLKKYLVALIPFLFFVLVREGFRLLGPEGLGWIATTTTVLNITRLFLFLFWIGLILSVMIFVIILSYDISDIFTRRAERKEARKISKM